jgi:nitrate/nitrite transport system ATP-binding protein
MKQRVGIARAFAIQPKMLLAGRALRRARCAHPRRDPGRAAAICAETHQTVFMITHDVDEAILLADRILLMTNGPRGAHRGDRGRTRCRAIARATRSTTTRTTTASATTSWTSSCIARA